MGEKLCGLMAQKQIFVLYIILTAEIGHRPGALWKDARTISYVQSMDRHNNVCISLVF